MKTQTKSVEIFSVFIFPEDISSNATLLGCWVTRSHTQNFDKTFFGAPMFFVYSNLNNTANLFILPTKSLST